MEDKKDWLELNENEYVFSFCDDYQMITLKVVTDKKGKIIKEDFTLNNRHSIHKDDPQFSPHYSCLKNMAETLINGKDKAND